MGTFLFFRVGGGGYFGSGLQAVTGFLSHVASELNWLRPENSVLLSSNRLSLLGFALETIFSHFLLIFFPEFESNRD